MVADDVVAALTTAVVVDPVAPELDVPVPDPIPRAGPRDEHAVVAGVVDLVADDLDVARVLDPERRRERSGELEPPDPEPACANDPERGLVGVPAGEDDALTGVRAQRHGIPRVNLPVEDVPAGIGPAADDDLTAARRHASKGDVERAPGPRRRPARRVVSLRAVDEVRLPLAEGKTGRELPAERRLRRRVAGVTRGKRNHRGARPDQEETHGQQQPTPHPFESSGHVWQRRSSQRARRKQTLRRAGEPIAREQSWDANRDQGNGARGRVC